MFGLFKKDPVKKLEEKHAALMQEAMAIQRSGDLKLYAKKISEAEALMDEILKLKNK